MLKYMIQWAGSLDAERPWREDLLSSQVAANLFYPNFQEPACLITMHF